MNRVDLAATGRFALTAAHGHECGVSVFTGLNAVLAGAQDGKRLIGCIHLKGFAATEPLHAEIQRPYRKLDLNGPVIQVKKREAGAGV